MAIPKTVEQALDPEFRIDECADNAELQAWLTWTSPAIEKAHRNLANAKYDHELAIEEHKDLYNQEVVTGEGGITEKKIAAETNEGVIEAYKKVIEAKNRVRLAEAILEGMKEKAGCIRKIATLRANMIQYDEGSIAQKRDSRLPSHEEQPNYGNQLPPPPPMNNFNGYNKPAGSFMG